MVAMEANAVVVFTDELTQLEKDIQCRPRGILEGISHGISHDACLALFSFLDAKFLAELLAIVPSATCIGHHDGDHTSRRNAADKSAK